MRYLKKFEGFMDFFGKKSNNKSWEEKVDDIYQFYIKNKNKSKRDLNLLETPMVSINDTFDGYISFSSICPEIQITLYDEDKTGEKNRSLEVVDFSEANYEDPNCNKGVYKIDKQTYNKYLIKAEEIRDWLDLIDEEDFNKSKSSIGSDGDINIDIDESEIAIEEINDELIKHVPIGEEFEFEISYYKWTSNNTNEQIVERRNFKITDFRIDFSGGRFYINLFTIDHFNNKCSIWIESDSNYEYYDLDKSKKPYDYDKIISMDIYNPEMTQKQKREYDKNRKYPYVISYDITPSKWESIELIKSMTEILKQLNNEIKSMDL